MWCGWAVGTNGDTCWYQRMGRCRSAAAVTYPDGIPNPWLWKSLLLTHSRSRSIYPLNADTHFPEFARKQPGRQRAFQEVKQKRIPCAGEHSHAAHEAITKTDAPAGPAGHFFLSWLKHIEACYPDLWSTLTHVWSSSMNVDNHSIAGHSVWLQSSTLGRKNDTIHQWNHCKKKINLVASLDGNTI